MFTHHNVEKEKKPQAVVQKPGTANLVKEEPDTVEEQIGGRLLALQSSLGNHYVQRLLGRLEPKGVVQPKMRVRPADGRYEQEAEPAAPNNTGLPDQLKAGIEAISGLAMDDVKVHYNSDKPAQFQAHAYAQRTDIHLATGQEKHLPHEAWHVVQQKQGRVKPTIQLRGKVTINDDAQLEKEANVMGKIASISSISKISGENDMALQERMSHGTRCSCSACNSISRKSVEPVYPNLSLVKNAKVTIENKAQANTSTGVLQRIQCDVLKNSRLIGSSPNIGKGGIGGVSHAEQKAWDNAGPPAVGAGDIIKFQVDGPICGLCTEWFENTLYPEIHGQGATLMVNVIYNEPGGSQYYGTIEVTGPGTVWGKVSEAGYYGDGGMAGDMEVVRAIKRALN